MDVVFDQDYFDIVVDKYFNQQTKNTIYSMIDILETNGIFDHNEQIITYIMECDNFEANEVIDNIIAILKDTALKFLRDIGILINETVFQTLTLEKIEYILIGIDILNYIGIENLAIVESIMNDDELTNKEKLVKIIYKLIPIIEPFTLYDVIDDVTNSFMERVKRKIYDLYREVDNEVIDTDIVETFSSKIIDNYLKLVRKHFNVNNLITNIFLDTIIIDGFIYSLQYDSVKIKSFIIKKAILRKDEITNRIKLLPYILDIVILDYITSLYIESNIDEMMLQTIQLLEEINTITNKEKIELYKILNSILTESGYYNLIDKRIERFKNGKQQQNKIL